MRVPSQRTLRPLGLARAILLAVIVLVGASTAFANVYGRLQFTVKNADDEKPVVGAKITLHDTAGVHADTSLLTDKDGMALSQPLEIRLWGVTVTSELFQPDTRQVQVAADTNTPIEVLLEPLKEKVVTITGQKQLVTATQTVNVSRRDQPFIKTFPLNPANPLNLANLVGTNPGIVSDAINVEHPRGECGSTTIVIDGFALPGANQGRIGQVLVPSEIQSADVLTGAYAPEYGGECAAILNMNLRSGSITPTGDVSFGGGSFSTYCGELSLSGQAGPPIDSSNDTADSAKRFGYFIDLAGRTTANAVQPPQPDQQTAHNAGSNDNLFGNFNYTLGPRDKITLTLNDDQANSQIANRTGLPDSFASVGQGFGYTGHLSAAEAATEGIGSQQADGQDINQRDLNQFSLLNWQHEINPTTTSTLSVGYIKFNLGLTNNNPAINLSALPFDNSIEFNPTLTRDSVHGQAQGCITNTSGQHTFKLGGLYDDQTGNESYQFIPASQLALDALATLDLRLAPAGSFTGGTDELGNKIYTLSGSNSASPTLIVHRSGYYGAAYAQDTWNLTHEIYRELWSTP